MAGLMAVTIEYEGLLTLKQRDINAILRSGMNKIGHYWRANYLPGHFSKRGARKYGYTPRSGETGSSLRYKGSYAARKLKEKGHSRPLVYTGKSAAEALASRQVIAKATSKKATSEVPLPRGYNRRPKKGRIHMGKELTTTTSDEDMQIEKVLVGHLAWKLKIAGQTGGIKVRIAG